MQDDPTNPRKTNIRARALVAGAFALALGAYGLLRRDFFEVAHPALSTPVLSPKVATDLAVKDQRLSSWSKQAALDCEKKLMSGASHSRNILSQRYSESNGIACTVEDVFLEPDKPGSKKLTSGVFFMEPPPWMADSPAAASIIDQRGDILPISQAYASIYNEPIHSQGFQASALIKVAGVTFGIAPDGSLNWSHPTPEKGENTYIIKPIKEKDLDPHSRYAVEVLRQVQEKQFFTYQR